MAKDPAFLFYPGDWNLGTMHMTLIEKGAYIELLMLQFSRGKFTLAHAKHMLNGSFDLVWPTVAEKFKKEGEFYWNQRLEEEKEKRSKFTKSRRDNASKEKQPNKKQKAYAKHMPKHMENEDVNENVNRNKDEKEVFTNPFSENFLLVWKQWKDYKKTEFSFQYKSVISEQAAVNELVKLSGGNEQIAKEIIMQSLTNGWKGFFQLKNVQNGKQKSNNLRAEVQEEFNKRYGNG